MTDYDMGLYEEFQKRCKAEGRFGDVLLRRLDFASRSTREMCARYAESIGKPLTAARLRR